MQIVIDQDTSPQVIAASLTISAGQKMALSVQVPLSYALTHGPIGQMYIDGIGGRAEAQSISGDVVTITAHSKIGSTTLDRSKYDPTYAAATSLTAWLDRIAAAVSGGTSYSADGAILDAAPYTHGMAASSPYQLLTTIAGCYGMDIIHYSTDTGDVFKVAQPLSQASGSISIGDLSSLTYDDAIADAETVSIVKTAPIQQHDKTVASMGSGLEIKRTSQGLPYYDGSVRYNQISRFWDGRTTTISKEEIIQQLDVPVVLADPDASDDPWYKTKFAYSPYFGIWLQAKRDQQEDNLYSTSVTGSPYSGHTTELRLDRLDTPPTTGTWEHSTASYTARREQYFGVFSVRRVIGTTAYNFFRDIFYAHPPEGEPQHTKTQDNSNGIIDRSSLYPSVPYIFWQPYDNSRDSQKTDYYVTDSYSTTNYKYIDYQVENDAVITQLPNAAQYPWLPCRRDLVSSTDSTTHTTPTPGVSVDDTTNASTVSAALFDTGWDDLTHPPTIDEDFIELSGVTLPKTAAVTTWFDASAQPDADRQWMGIGCIGNIRYSAGRGERKLTLRPGMQPGRLTARAMSGQVQHFNIQRAFSLYRLGAVAPVIITFIASGEKSFTVPQHQNPSGRVYSITGTVWREPATARACIPYIQRQHNPGRRVRFTIPTSVRTVSDAIDITGTVQTLVSERVYITGITVDYRAGLITYSGRVIADNQ